VDGPSDKGDDHRRGVLAERAFIAPPVDLSAGSHRRSSLRNRLLVTSTCEWTESRSWGCRHRDPRPWNSGVRRLSSNHGPVCPQEVRAEGSSIVAALSAFTMPHLRNARLTSAASTHSERGRRRSAGARKALRKPQAASWWGRRHLLACLGPLGQYRLRAVSVRPRPGMVDREGGGFGCGIGPVRRVVAP
jgi:hypothetical protein